MPVRGGVSPGTTVPDEVIAEDALTALQRAMKETGVSPEEQTVADPFAGESITPVEDPAMSQDPQTLEDLEAEQQSREYIQSFQQRVLSPDSFDLSEENMKKVFGAEEGSALITQSRNLVDFLDHTHLTQNQKGLLYQGVPVTEIFRKPELGERTVDNQGNIPLTQASALLVGFEAGIPSTDERQVVLDQDFTLTALITVEGLLAQEYNPEKEQEKMMSPQERKDMLGRSHSEVTEEESERVSMAAYGERLYDEWMKIKQVRDSGSFTTMADAHISKPKPTQEALALAGMWAKEMYSRANPEMLTKLPPVKKKTATGYTMEEGGYAVLDYPRLARRAAKSRPARIRRRGLVGKADPQGQPKYEQKEHVRKSTGSPASQQDLKSYLEMQKETAKTHNYIEQAIQNFSQVRNVADPFRTKMAMAFSLDGLMNNAYVTQEHSVSAEVLGVGKDRVETIEKIAKRYQVEMDSIIAEAEEAKRNGNEQQLDELRTKYQEVKTKRDLYSQEETKQAEFMNYANRQLEMVQDLAEHAGLVFSNTYSHQRGLDRINMQQTGMNVQAHKFIRGVLGSGTVYQIKPGSSSTIERAMLLSFAATLFEQGGLVPHKAVDAARDSISNPNERTQRLARVGGKIKAAFADFNVQASLEEVSQVQATPQGVMGMDRITTRVPAALKEDKDVADFLEEAATHPDEFLHILDSVVALNEYMDAKKNGTTFSTTYRPAEVDGISNGLSALLTYLGSQGMGPRVGLLYDYDEEEVLPFGNVRDLYAENLVSMTPQFIDASENKTVFGKLTDTQKEALIDIMKLAVKDKDNFLKPPMMTLPYGQELGSMGQYSVNTILTSPQIQELVDTHFQSTWQASNLMHQLANKTLTATLGEDVMVFVKLMKEMGERSVVMNEPIVYKKPSGGLGTFIGSELNPGSGEALKVSSYVKQPEALPSGQEFYKPSKKAVEASGGKLRPAIEKQRTMLEKIVTMAEGKRGQLGRKIPQVILPQSVINFDGATIAMLGSNAMMSKIAKKVGGVPYIVPIFDAIVTDLGSMIPAVEAINHIWMNTVHKHDLIGEIHKGSQRSDKVGLDKFKRAAQSDPNGIPEDRVHMQFILQKSLEEIQRESRKEMPSILFMNLMKINFGSMIRQDGSISNSAMYSVVKAHVEAMDRHAPLDKQIGNFNTKIKKAREEYFEGVKRSNQFAVDTVKWN